MDGLGQLFVSQNGSVYALVPAAEPNAGPSSGRAQGMSALATESDIAQALLAQLLQRQQHGLPIRQPLAPPHELDNLPAEQALAHARGPRPDETLSLPLLHSSLPLLQSLQQQSNPLLVPSNQLPSAQPARPNTSHVSRRVVSVESPSNSDSQSPPPSTRGERNGLGSSVSVSAKEKNRQAQRRFRERQKDLITNLKLRVETLQAKVQENEKEITALKEENAMLRGRVEGKQLSASVTLPAEALQSLLQMTGAGSLLAEAAAAAAAAAESGAGGGGGGGGLMPFGLGPRGGRGLGAGSGAPDLGLRGSDEERRPAQGLQGLAGLAGFVGRSNGDGDGAHS